MAVSRASRLMCAAVKAAADDDLMASPFGGGGFLKERRPLDGRLIWCALCALRSITFASDVARPAERERLETLSPTFGSLKLELKLKAASPRSIKTALTASLSFLAAHPPNEQLYSFWRIRCTFYNATCRLT